MAKWVAILIATGRLRPMIRGIDATRPMRHPDEGAQRAAERMRGKKKPEEKPKKKPSLSPDPTPKPWGESQPKEKPKKEPKKEPGFPWVTPDGVDPPQVLRPEPESALDPEPDDDFLTSEDKVEAALSIANNANDLLSQKQRIAAAAAAARFKAQKGPTMSVTIPPKVSAGMARKAGGKAAVKTVLRNVLKPADLLLNAKEVFDLATDPKAREDADKMVKQMSKENALTRVLKSQADPMSTLYGTGRAFGKMGEAKKGAKHSASNYQKLVAIAAHTEEKFPRTEGVKRTRKEQEKIAAYRQQLLSEVTVVPGRKKKRVIFGPNRPAIPSSIKFPDGSSRPFVDPKTYKLPRNKSFAEKEADKARASGDIPVK
jgi:hypothetical protein